MEVSKTYILACTLTLWKFSRCHAIWSLLHLYRKLLLISLNKKLKYCAWTNCKTDCGCLFAKLIRLTSWLYSISHWHLQLLVLNVSTVIPFSTLMVHRYASRDFLLTLSHYTHSIPLYSHYPIILALIPLYSQYPIILALIPLYSQYPIILTSHYTHSIPFLHVYFLSLGSV